MAFRWTFQQGENPSGDTPNLQTKVYEVVEFVSLKPSDPLVSAVRYRTFYHPDGKIRHERIPNTGLIRSMIEDHSGYSIETGSTITGFFDDTEDAAKCAKAINHIFRTTAEVCGTHLVIAV